MRTRLILGLATLAWIASGCAGRERRSEPLPEREWAVAGRWFEACTCTIPCPCCTGSGPPTLGHCSRVHAFRIDEGHHGTIVLDGMWVVQVAQSRSGGCAAGVDADLELGQLYVDDGVGPEKLRPLERVFSHLVGSGPPLRGRTIEQVDLSGFATENQAAVAVPGLLRAEVFVPPDEADPAAPPAAHPPWVVPPATPAKSILLRFRDGRFDWQVLGRHALLGRFAASSSGGGSDSAQAGT